jgi:putative DNA primase/helicase
VTLRHPSKQRLPTREEDARWNGYDDDATNLPHLNLKRCADMTEQPITWLWQDRIPAGKLTLICGDPGKGKSILTTDIGSRVSVGAAFPDGAPGNDPGSVIIFSAEDDAEDTILPRLIRAGADRSKCFVMESVTHTDPTNGDAVHQPFGLGEHVPLLEAAVKSIGDV